jgi:tricarballylate dehydrogenase
MPRAGSYDVVVIGCGAGGLTAALSALEAAEGAGSPIRIAVLERASKQERGGKTRHSSGSMRLKDMTTVLDTFVQDLLSHSEGIPVESYVRTLAERGPQTVAWVEGKGVRFEREPREFLTLDAPRVKPVGAGKAVLDALIGHVEAAGAGSEENTETGVTILYETTALQLTSDDNGLIDGVETRGADGHLRRLSAGAVIIASGGFEGNPEMMTQYIGHDVPPVSAGGRYNRGEGIRMALAAGAKPAGQWDRVHCLPVDARSIGPDFSIATFRPIVTTIPWGIVVNLSGERFLDEGAASIDDRYDRVAQMAFQQEEHIAFVVFDQRTLGIPGYRERAIDLTDEPYKDETRVFEPYQADTIEELAAATRVDPAALIGTILAYNAATSSDQSRFDPARTDGLGTVGGLQPPKSNWARPIDRPPFFAYPIGCASVFTFGGIGTDEQARVLSADGYPIPGLFAAGEATGLYHGKYVGSTSLLRTLVFGRIAGLGAARHVLTEDDRVGGPA